MKTTNERFKRTTDDSGEDYYCPLGRQTEAGPESDLASCVEVSTVERYAGNLNIID